MKLWALCLLVACGPAATMDRQANRPDWLAQEDALAVRMQALAQSLAARGLEIGSAHGRIFLAEGDARTLELTMEAHRCWTLVAIASHTVRDLDAAAYAPSGETLAEDIQPDAHPTLQLCSADTPRRFYVHFAAYDGAGPFLYAAFESADRSAFAAAAEVLGGRPGVESEIEEDQRLAELERALLRRGFRVAGQRREVRFGPDQELQLPLSLTPGRCFTLALFAQSGLRVGLEVLSSGGESLARDGSSEQPSLQLCADRTDEARLVASAQGAGSARLIRYEGTAGDVGGEGGLWLGERHAPVAGSPERECNPEQLVCGRELQRERVHVRPGDAGEVVASVPSGKCLRWEAHGQRGVRRIELAAHGRRTSGPSPALHHCTSGESRVQWSVVGAGEVVLRASILTLEAEELTSLPDAAKEALLDASWNGQSPD